MAVSLWPTKVDYLIQLCGNISWPDATVAVLDNLIRSIMHHHTVRELPA